MTVPEAQVSVVVVDDYDDVRALVTRTLEQSNRFKVVADARNGREAIEVAASLQPDVVLLDISMPVLNGIDALPLIRQAAPSAIVVMLSSLTDEDTRQAAFAAGATAYIEKGAPPEEFLSRLAEVLDADVSDGQPVPIADEILPFTVLLVDDVEELRALYRRAFDRTDRFRVVAEAGDGIAAVREAGTHLPDLVLLDLSMPRMDGLSAMPQIRAAAPAAKVVVVSSMSRTRMWPLSEQAGAVGYIEKGKPMAELLDELLVVCGALDVVEEVLREATTSLAADLRSARAARRFLDEVIELWDCGTEVDAVRLAVTELVGNAVVHAQSEVDVSVALIPTGLRVTVTDHSAILPEIRHVPPDAESGRGLALLDALVSRWGVDERPMGKAVWFEVPRLDRVQ
jgi:DNA-binding NarL/FixJ family response regulator